MVEVVEVRARVGAGVERPLGRVGLVEARAEAAEQPRHREVSFAVAVVHGGIEDDGRPVREHRAVAGPEVAVQQGRQRAVAGEERGNPLDEPAAAILQAAAMAVFRRAVELESESPLAPEIRPVIGGRVRLRRRADRVVAVEAVAAARDGMQPRERGAHVRVGAGIGDAQVEQLQLEPGLAA